MRPTNPKPITPMPTRSFAPRTRWAESALVETMAVVWATRLRNSRRFIVVGRLRTRLRGRASTGHSGILTTGLLELEIDVLTETQWHDRCWFKAVCLWL